MKKIPDFTEAEVWTIQTTLNERYKEEMELQLAEGEIRLSTTDRELTVCPAAYWEHENCHFIIFKAGEERYRCQFFYRVHQQYGTNIHEFDDLAECTVVLLQTQADHEVDGQKEAI
jgi:hypothetical protein